MHPNTRLSCLSCSQGVLNPGSPLLQGQNQSLLPVTEEKDKKTKKKKREKDKRDLPKVPQPGPRDRETLWKKPDNCLPGRPRREGCPPHTRDLVPASTWHFLGAMAVED